MAQKGLKGFSNSSQLGEYSEIVVMSAFMKEGLAVLRPFGDNLRYDLLVDTGKNFLRIQVKSATLRDGYLRFKLASGNGTAKNPYKFYNEDQADFFAVYCLELDQIYMLPVDSKVTQLRVVEPRNNQVKHVKWAKDYSFSRWLKSALSKDSTDF